MNKITTNVTEVTATDVFKDLFNEPSKTGRFFDPTIHSSGSKYDQMDDTDVDATDMFEDMLNEPKKIGKLYNPNIF